MDRSKIVAVITGAIAIILSIAYLLVVQFLDFRGEMVPAPQDLSQQAVSTMASANSVGDRLLLPDQFQSASK